jgi:hypothetical protein
MGRADNNTTDILELLHKTMIKSAYRASNKKDFEKQILWYNDRVTWLSYMEHNLRFLALNGYYKDQSAYVLGLLSEKDNKNFQRRTVIQRISCSELAHPPVHPVDTNNLIISNIPTLFGAIKGPLRKISLLNAEEYYKIPGLAKCFRSQLINQWGVEIFNDIFPNLLLREFADKLMIYIYNGVKYWKREFHPPTILAIIF